MRISERLTNVHRHTALYILFQVCQDFRLACDSVCKAKCLAHIPSDIFIELWEELGLSETIDYIEVS